MQTLAWTPSPRLLTVSGNLSQLGMGQPTSLPEETSLSSLSHVYLQLTASFVYSQKNFIFHGNLLGLLNHPKRRQANTGSCFGAKSPLFPNPGDKAEGIENSFMHRQ